MGAANGRTTSRAVPAILEAPGAVIATSNKHGLADATRDVRAEKGKVWVFDPQGIAREEPTWWCNPLSYVTDEVRAANRAEHFAAGSHEAGAKTDAFFTQTGQDFLAGLPLRRWRRKNIENTTRPEEPLPYRDPPPGMFPDARD